MRREPKSNCCQGEIHFSDFIGPVCCTCREPCIISKRNEVFHLTREEFMEIWHEIRSQAIGEYVASLPTMTFDEFMKGREA